MDSSPLALLPPELRNAIYTATFTTPYATQLSPGSITHPLARTCRQIRAETLEMFLSLTRFNAHLDDGPATPLARWLTVMGPSLCLRLREVKVWDMHMLNGTLHGEAATEGMLREGPRKEGFEASLGSASAGSVAAIASGASTALGAATASGGSAASGAAAAAGENEGRYVLRPVGRQVFHKGWYLKDIILALQAMGLGLARFCILQDEHGSEEKMKQTSDFALMRMDQLDRVTRNSSGDGHEAGGAATTAEILAEQFGLSEAERESLAAQLENGRSEVRLLDGRRNIVMMFDGARRLVSLRQEFIPRDEEFYL